MSRPIIFVLQVSAWSNIANFGKICTCNGPISVDKLHLFFFLFVLNVGLDMDI